MFTKISCVALVLLLITGCSDETKTVVNLNIVAPVSGAYVVLHDYNVEIVGGIATITLKVKNIGDQASIPITYTIDHELIGDPTDYMAGLDLGPSVDPGNIAVRTYLIGLSTSGTYRITIEFNSGGSSNAVKVVVIRCFDYIVAPG